MSTEGSTSTETEAAAVETVAADATLVTDSAASAEGIKDEAGNEAENEAEAGTGEQAGSEVEAEAEAEKAGAPEEYADFTMPEGIELDSSLTDEFKTVAKEANLTQDQAQKFVELATQMRQRDAETIIEMRQSWVEQTKADPELGGDKLDATLGTAKKAIAAYGSEQFIKLLNETGLGNHPEFVRFCASAGKSVAEDPVVIGGNKQSTPQRTLATRLYGPDKE